MQNLNLYADGTTFSARQGWVDPDDWVKNQANSLKDIYHVYDDSVKSADIPDRMHLYPDNNPASEPERSKSRFSLRQKLGAAFLVAATAASAFGIFKANDHDEAPRSQPVATATATSEASPQPGLETSTDIPQTLDIDSLVKNTYGSKEAITEGSPIVTFSFVDGKIVPSDLAPNLQDSDPAFALIKDVVLDNETSLVAANKSKTLEGVTFEFDPLLDHETAYFQRADSTPGSGSHLDMIHYVLPANGKIDKDNIVTTISHENIHALVEQLGLVDRDDTAILSAEIVPVDMERYGAICSAMRDDAVTGALSDATKSIKALSELTNRIPSEYKSKFDEVLSSMRDGTFGKYQATQGEAQGMWESVLQSCSVDDPWKVISRELRAESKTLPNEVLNDPTTHELYATMREEWSYAIRDQPLYAAIRESSYIVGDSGEAGHPYDNANELITSALNITLKFPDELRDNLQNLSPNQQELLKELLRIASADLTRLHQATAPEFTDKVTAAVERVTNLEA